MCLYLKKKLLIWLQQANKTLKIGLPVAVSRSGFIALILIDTAMVGRIGADELAIISIATGPQVFLMLVGLGLLRGGPILIAQAFGAGQNTKCGHIFRLVMVYALFIGIILTTISLFGESILKFFGQQKDLALGGGKVMQNFAIGLIPFLFWIGICNFLEGIGRTIAPMIISSLAILISPGLNLIFIYGNLGIPEMGASGAQLATSILRIIMFLIIFLYIFLNPNFHTFKLFKKMKVFWKPSAQLRKLGYALGIAAGIEAFAYAILTMIGGIISKATLSIFQIVNTSIGMVFMIAIGLGAAAAVQVGQAIGKNDKNMLLRKRDVKSIGWTSIILLLIMMTFLMLPFVIYPTKIASLYTNEISLINSAKSSIIIAGLALIFNGIQAVWMGALRGAGDVWFPMNIQIFSSIFIMVPSAWFLAIILNLGAVGLISSILLSVLISSIILTIRFIIIIKKGLQRI
ncbi:MATE family efflux transporter [Alphaproteobacteria bacterium]|nr:MATE family efflux transporter [Alphaproteobacteria bacterium]